MTRPASPMTNLEEPRTVRVGEWDATDGIQIVDRSVDLDPGDGEPLTWRESTGLWLWVILSLSALLVGSWWLWRAWRWGVLLGVIT